MSPACWPGFGLLLGGKDQTAFGYFDFDRCADLESGLAEPFTPDIDPGDGRFGELVVVAVVGVLSDIGVDGLVDFYVPDGANFTFLRACVWLIIGSSHDDLLYRLLWLAGLGCLWHPWSVLNLIFNSLLQ